MADIAPIRGLTYDATRVDVARVIAPPYDVISEEERVALEAQDPYNVVRIDLPRGEGDAKYPAAAKILADWRKEGIVRRDDQPALYRYHQIYRIAELGDRDIVRRGFIAAGRLHPYDDAIVKPHERTLRGPKEDRLKLMRATRAHFSQIFTLYSDPQRATDQAFAAAEELPPGLEGKTADGTLHRVWRVTDAPTIQRVQELMRDKALYIADGHHRYETMLALREEIRAEAGGSPRPRASTEFGTYFMANMDDPGLVVLPTHRLLHAVPGFTLDKLIDGARTWFDVDVLAGAAKDAARVRAALADGARRRPTLAIVAPGKDDVWVLGLKVAPTDTGLTGHASLLSLDVTLLHGLLFERLLGIDREAQAKQSHLEYVKDTKKALDAIAAGKAQVGFLLHPTRVDQVRDVADAGEVMPQKSTFFYPKIASGLVMNPLDPTEDLK